MLMQQLDNLSNSTTLNDSFNYDGTFDTEGTVLPPTVDTSRTISKVFLENLLSTSFHQFSQIHQSKQPEVRTTNWTRVTEDVGH